MHLKAIPSESRRIFQLALGSSGNDEQYGNVFTRTVPRNPASQKPIASPHQRPSRVLPLLFPFFRPVVLVDPRGPFSCPGSPYFSFPVKRAKTEETWPEDHCQQIEFLSTSRTIIRQWIREPWQAEPDHPQHLGHGNVRCFGHLNICMQGAYAL